MRKILPFLLLTISTMAWSSDFHGWNQISTDHYRFIYEEKDKNTAFELATEAEEIYSKVTDFFGFYPPKINIYINSGIDTPNGFFYPIPGSINLYPVYPFQSGNTTKGRSRLYELLLHEMVHYVNMEYQKGLFGGLSYIFGKDLAAANGAFMPAWMVEGIAVYLETELTDGGRGRNRYFEAYNKAAAIENNYYNIYQAAYSSNFPPYNRIYSGGYLIIKYMIDNYGRDIFQRVYRRYIKFPFFGPFYAIKKETGKNIKEIYEDLKISEIEKYSSEIKILDEFRSKEISYKSIGDWTHPVMTDMGLLVYRTAPDKKSAIILYDEKNQKEEILIETNLMDGSSFSTNKEGNIIVFAKANFLANYRSDRKDEIRYQNSALYNFGNNVISDLYLLKDGKVNSISSGKSLFQPAISPDGKRIVAVQREGSYSKLVEINLSTGKIYTLFQKDNTNIMNPSFSPQSQKIVFTLNDHGLQDIYTMRLNKPETASPLFSTDHHGDYYPRFINEERVSFISDRDGSLSMYSYNLYSKELLLLYKDPVGVMDGFINDNNIYYHSYRTSGNKLRKGELTNSTHVELVSTQYTPGKTEIKTFSEKNYIDWAFPYLWLPKPDINISNSEGVQFGFGVAVFAASLAHTGEYLLNLNFLPGLLQFQGSFDYSRKLGPLELSYNIYQTFNELQSNNTNFWRQKTLQSASIFFPLFENNDFNWRNIIKSYFSFQHKLQISKASTFSIADSFQMDSENFLYGSVGLIYSGYKTNSSRKALFGGLFTYNRLDFTLLFPLLTATETAFIIRESGAFSIPAGPEGFLLQIGWESAYSNQPYSSSTVNGKGFTPSIIPPSDISVLYSLDYLIPIALVDIGMPFGFNIQNFAAAIHLEGISNFTFSGGSYTELYCGLELIGTFGYNYGNTPAGVGINFRVFRQNGSFNPAEDITVYFFLSFNSMFSEIITF